MHRSIWVCLKQISSLCKKRMLWDAVCSKPFSAECRTMGRSPEGSALGSDAPAAPCLRWKDMDPEDGTCGSFQWKMWKQQLARPWCGCCPCFRRSETPPMIRDSPVPVQRPSALARWWWQANSIWRWIRAQSETAYGDASSIAESRTAHVEPVAPSVIGPANMCLRISRVCIEFKMFNSDPGTGKKRGKEWQRAIELTARFFSV